MACRSGKHAKLCGAMRSETVLTGDAGAGGAGARRECAAAAARAARRSALARAGTCLSSSYGCYSRAGAVSACSADAAYTYPCQGVWA